MEGITTIKANEMGGSQNFIPIQYSVNFVQFLGPPAIVNGHPQWMVGEILYLILSIQFKVLFLQLF